MSVITRELPAMSKVESAVKLAIGKAAEVCQVYLVHRVTVTECDGSSWVFYSQEEGRYVLLPNLKRR